MLRYLNAYSEDEGDTVKPFLHFDGGANTRERGG
jgi:hypothetical protein